MNNQLGAISQYREEIRLTTQPMRQQPSTLIAMARKLRDSIADCEKNAGFGDDAGGKNSEIGFFRGADETSRS